MPKKRPASLLQKEAQSKKATRKVKKCKTVPASSPQISPGSVTKQTPASQPNKASPQQQDAWDCRSEVDKQAAHAVGRLLEAHITQQGGVTLKGLTLAPHIKDKKATFAVTCETLRHVPVLKPLVQQTGLLANSQLRPEVAYVLAYEVLFGKGCKVQGPAEKVVCSAKVQLQAALRGLLSDHAAKDVQSLLRALGAVREPDPRPRTARVNTLKLSVAEALQWLRSPPPQRGHIKPLEVEVDGLLPDLLVFPPGTELHDHPLVAWGCLVLQSKASCMPAHAVQPEPGWDVIDACAAPGNKTTHAAALMGAQGRIFAFDKDAKRLKRLQANAALCGASNIVAQQGDFLRVDLSSETHANVKAVILDPSCSGSGTTVSRMDHLLPLQQTSSTGSSKDVGLEERVEALAQFQEKALRHALLLPRLQRLVYSTCSIHARENEDVIRAVLPFATSHGFQLKDPFPAWHRRGLPILPDHNKLVRVDQHKDGTDGFFVALFVREPIAQVQLR